VLNVFGDDWDAEQTQPGFTWKRLRLGRRLGAEKLGASVFELPPGQRSFPYHLHHANEELLIVLEGSVSVRGKDGERTLARGESALFPIGDDGAHQVINRSEQHARFLVLSTMVEPDITEFPDTGKVGLFAGAPPGGSAPRTLQAFLRRDAEVDYFEGEP
jgi:uncharacterized cupin superfamily protein